MLQMFETTASKLLRTVRKLGRVDSPDGPDQNHLLKTMPDGSVRKTNFGTHNNPIPRLHGEWDSGKRWKKLQASLRAKKYTDVDVPVHKIKSRQNYVHDAGVVKALSNKKPATGVKSADGEHYYVMDGNHRVTRDLLLGKSHTRMRVYHTEESDSRKRHKEALSKMKSGDHFTYDSWKRDHGYHPDPAILGSLRYSGKITKVDQPASKPLRTAVYRKV